MIVGKRSLPAYLLMSLFLIIVEELTHAVALTLAGRGVGGPN